MCFAKRFVPVQPTSSAQSSDDVLGALQIFRLRIVHHPRLVQTAMDTGRDPTGSRLAKVAASDKRSMSSCCFSGATVKTLICVMTPSFPKRKRPAQADVCLRTHCLSRVRSYPSGTELLHELQK